MTNERYIYRRYRILGSWRNANDLSKLMKEEELAKVTKRNRFINDTLPIIIIQTTKGMVQSPMKELMKGTKGNLGVR